ncbi:TIGR01212 family radical SAM protein [Veillonella sp. CHU110]|uniref:TIGR01212 family radical SAM protein n=1 Tax=Veillonella sp. CHU110 TaxID=2490947 RepID=UPI000F8DC11F|nr:TIGR01212 family radical SAM protein [Veillonella sp. CHU110]
MSDTTKPKRYRMISVFYKERYGEKAYKIPVALPLTCPNRDGSAGVGGCTFCGEIGAGYENRPASMTVKQQIDETVVHIAKKYKAYKYIPYFQNFSNTYLPPEKFRHYVEEACLEHVVGIAIATRPDCVHDVYLDILKDIQNKYGIDIYVELGLQSVNYHTLQKVNRGHTMAEFIDAVLRIKRYGFEVCTHMILNLPWDTMDDVIEGAKTLSALQVDQVKLHALYLVKNTKMTRDYEAGEFTLISAEEYARRVVEFLRYLDPKIVLQRLVGRAPEENTIFTNWSMGWWRVQDLIDQIMEDEDISQGSGYNYLHGAAVQKFL